MDREQRSKIKKILEILNPLEIVLGDTIEELYLKGESTKKLSRAYEYIDEAYSLLRKSTIEGDK